MSVPTSVTPFDLSRTFTLDQGGKDQPVDREKLVKMAQEFEGMLLLQMVRQMRQSMLMDEEEETGLGNATMTDTFDVELANYLAKQGGIGLSKSIEQHREYLTCGVEVLMGSDALALEAFRLGASGAVSAIANIEPRLLLELAESFTCEEASAIQGKIIALREGTRTSTSPIAAMKRELADRLPGYPTQMRAPLS